MINLQTGELIFPELAFRLSPLLLRTAFISSFSKERINEIRDMKNGYIWYDVREKVYETDFRIPISLCFNPQDRLEFIEFFPQYFETESHRAQADWSVAETLKEKKYCAEWLSQYCGIQKEENQFSWGTIAVFYDPRSVSSGIVIHYKNQSV